MAENITRIKSGVMANVGVSCKNYERNHQACEMDYLCNVATCSCENY